MAVSINLKLINGNNIQIYTTSLTVTVCRNIVYIGISCVNDLFFVKNMNSSPLIFPNVKISPQNSALQELT